MRGTRSLGLLVLSVVFCAGLALAAATAGISALATQTQQKLNPPTVLWNAYPLRAPRSSPAQPAFDNKPISTGTSKVSTTSPTRTSTGSTETRPTVAHGKRVASPPTISTGGFPTAFVMIGVIGALLASTLLLALYAAPARAGGYRLNSGPMTTRSRSRTGRARRPSPARRKPSRVKHPQSRLKPAAPRAEPMAPPESSGVEPASRTLPRPIEVKPVEGPEQASASVAESGLRSVQSFETGPHVSDGVRRARPQRRELVDDQFCEIKLWRGYVKCQLYVELEESPGAFFESSFFRLRNPAVADDRAQRILEDLLVGLERSGWFVVETGPVWYRRRLRRFTPRP